MPELIAVTKPVLEIVATDVFDEDHVPPIVRLFNCEVVPTQPLTTPVIGAIVKLFAPT